MRFSRLPPQPIFAKRFQPRQRFAVLSPSSRFFARDDVVEMTDRKAFDLNFPLPRILEPFDAIRGKNEVEIERAVLELHKILAPLDMFGLLISEREAEFP